MKSRQHFERAIQVLAPREAPPPSTAKAPTVARSASSGQLRVPVAELRTYAALREALTRYLSPILVDSVVQRALARRGFSQMSGSAADLAELTGEIMLGLRLFVPEDRLSVLMLELAEILDSGH